MSRYYVENFFGEERARELIKARDRMANDDVMPEWFSKDLFWFLCIQNMNERNDEGHGCTLRPLPKSSWQIVWSGVNQMANLGKGLQQFTELVPLIPSGIIVSLGYNAEHARLSFSLDEAITDKERGERYLELMALVFHCALSWIVDGHITVPEMRLSERLREEDGSLLSGFSPKLVRQGEGVTLAYRRSDLSLPLGARRYTSWATAETTAFLSLLARQQPLAPSADPIVDQVSSLLRDRAYSQSSAAKELATSVASLQRRLARAGTSFREISQDVRAKRLQTLLATDIGLDDAAEELGFSDRRSLWRACQAWFGMSPSELRSKQRSAASDHGE